MVSKNLATALSIHLFVRLSNLQWQQGHDNEYYEKAWWYIISSIPILADHWNKIYFISMEEITYANPYGIALYLSRKLLDEMLNGRRHVLCHILYRVWQLLKADPNLNIVLAPNPPVPYSAESVDLKPTHVPVNTRYTEWMHHTHETVSIPPTFSHYPGQQPADKSPIPPRWPLFAPKGLITLTDPQHRHWETKLRIDEDTL